ncbi:MAG: AAA family ATPase, partial [Planctomycetota bacterium]
DQNWEQLVVRRVEVTVDTPTEIARRDSESGQRNQQTLRRLAERMRPTGHRPTVGRTADLDRLDECFGTGKQPKIGNAGRAPRSVLLVGPPGVGKTAIFRGWWNRCRRRSKQSSDASTGTSSTPTPQRSTHQSSASQRSAAPTVWQTDGSRLISGQSGFGGWQQQCLEMLAEAKSSGAIIHFGNAMELSESGKAWGSGGVASLIAPRIAEGAVCAVMECTPQQYNLLSRQEPRLLSGLIRVDIAPASESENAEILSAAAAAWRPTLGGPKQKRWRKKTNRKGRPETPMPVVPQETLLWIDRLHHRFPTEMASPGRSLNFFESAISELYSESAGRPADQGPPQLTPSRITQAFCTHTGLPPFLVNPDTRPDLDAIAGQLGEQVLGQKQVIEVLVDLIAVLSTDLSRGDRPLASLLMIGPTGVGKTETAKAMARLIYGDVTRLVRIDMSEFSDPLSAMRLIGGGAGGDAHDDTGGVLTSAVQAQPFSLVLLDEFEKADPVVFDLLLQVLGEGRLTDGNGRVADFRNSILMMTSNLGVDSIAAKPLGLVDDDQKSRTQRDADHFARKVREHLRPEMFNRIDRILPFNALPQDVILDLAKRHLLSGSKRGGLLHRDIRVRYEEEVAAWVAARGYQPQFGARPLLRTIQQQVLTLMASAISEHDDVAQLNVR